MEYQEEEDMNESEILDQLDKCDQENSKLRKQLNAATEALRWYAGARCPDDGSGRPPDSFQHVAKIALAEIGNNQP